MGDDGDGGEGDDRNGVDGVNGSSDGTQETFVKASAPPLLAAYTWLMLLIEGHCAHDDDQDWDIVGDKVTDTLGDCNDDKQREELRLLSVGSQF